MVVGTPYKDWMQAGVIPDELQVASAALRVSLVAETECTIGCRPLGLGKL